MLPDLVLPETANLHLPQGCRIGVQERKFGYRTELLVKAIRQP